MTMIPRRELQEWNWSSFVRGAFHQNRWCKGCNDGYNLCSAFSFFVYRPLLMHGDATEQIWNGCAISLLTACSGSFFVISCSCSSIFEINHAQVYFPAAALVICVKSDIFAASVQLLSAAKHHVFKAPRVFAWTMIAAVSLHWFISRENQTFWSVKFVNREQAMPGINWATVK
jgi:hypothetical protein